MPDEGSHAKFDLPDGGGARQAPPLLVRLVALAAMCAAFLADFTPAQRLSGVLAAACFSVIEYSWYSVTTEDANGEVRFTPGAPTCRAGHTTAHQFLCNIVYTPVLLFWYRGCVPAHPAARVLLFPLNVWLLELVEGYALMALHGGRNPAWTYGTPDAAFHGNVRSTSCPPRRLGFVGGAMPAHRRSPLPSRRCASPSASYGSASACCSNAEASPRCPVVEPGWTTGSACQSAWLGACTARCVFPSGG